MKGVAGRKRKKGVPSASGRRTPTTPTPSRRGRKRKAVSPSRFRQWVAPPGHPIQQLDDGPCILGPYVPPGYVKKERIDTGGEGEEGVEPGTTAEEEAIDIEYHVRVGDDVHFVSDH